MVLFKNEPVSSMADFISKLNTFLTATIPVADRWVADVHTPASGRWAVSKDLGSETVEVAFQWDTTSPNHLGIYQYRTGLGEGSYNTGGGTVPFDQDGDSGNGAASTTDATIGTARHVTITDTPVQYWAFVGEDADLDMYVHVVVQMANLIDYEHFGFGVLDKINDWTGGEYAYGHHYTAGGSTNVAIFDGNCFLLDGIVQGTGFELHAATVHTEGLGDTPTGGLWSVVMGNQAGASLGNDRQGTPKGRTHMTGGCRGGSYAIGFGQFVGTTNLGFTPTYPMVLYHWDRNVSGVSSTVNHLTSPMGTMKDVRGILMRNYVAEQQVPIGADTWHIFPAKRLGVTGGLTSTTGRMGIMYKEG